MDDTRYPFLKGGGEMGALMRAHDWTATPLGAPNNWPQSLRTTLSLLLNSKFPMFLFWGPEHLCFYNNAYRPSLGNAGKHPAILGAKGKEAWPEIWDFIGPMIEGILAAGEATWFEDQSVPIYRNGHMEDVYWTFSYSPVSDESGSPAGVFVTCTETTQAVESIKTLRQTAHGLQESEALLERLSNSVPAMIFYLDAEQRYLSYNDTFMRWFGVGKDEAIGKTVREFLGEAAYARAQPHLAIAYAGQQECYEAPAPTRIDPDRWLCIVYTPHKAEDGIVTGVIVHATDITQSKRTETALRESEQFARAIFYNSPVAKLVYVGEDMVLREANEKMLEIFGRGPSIIGQPIMDAVPELRGTPLLEQYHGVLATGHTHVEHEAYIELVRDGEPHWAYYDYTYKPLQDLTGKIYGVICTAVDVTDQVRARQNLEESEMKLRSIVSTAPAAIGLFMGRDLVIENPNQTFIDIVGKGWDVLGKPLREAMPELLTEGQPFLKILDDVYTTGVAFHSPGSMVKIVQNGVMTHNYYNITYTPVRDDAGEVYAILDIAIDVTAQIKAQQETEETEARLRAAIELAELATWRVDLASGKISYSDRMRDWMGADAETLSAAEMLHIHEADRDRVISSMQAAVAPGGTGLFDEVFAITNATTGAQKILHAAGKTVFDESGAAVMLSGTAQDVTLQQELQLALENEVQIRTEELAAAVEELRATNENLAELNIQLTHSNDELAQYAYVASHDLQEPLRKIQVFTGMLSKQPGLPPATGPTIEKISSSAARMSGLIQDLLAFSRLLKSETLMRPVALAEVVEAVWSDFELTVEEKGATLQVGELPVIESVNLQMNQLFNNLVSNALKFTMPGKTPHITVASREASVEEVARVIRTPLTFAIYHHIVFTDNGIGFETEYSEQIFEVFKRLHGRDMYPGSGIGLALCRRIVANHNGHLYAESVPGNGSTFHIFLPSRQHDYTSAFTDAQRVLPTMH